MGLTTVISLLGVFACSGFATKRNEFPLRSSMVELDAGAVSSHSLAPQGPGLLRSDLDFARLSDGSVKEIYRYNGSAVFEYESVRTWFDGLRPSQGYKCHGLAYLREFCQYVGKEPDQLVGERKARLQRDRDARVDLAR